MQRHLIIAFVLIGIASTTQAKRNEIINRQPQQVGGDIGFKQIDVQQLNVEKANVGTTMTFRGSDAVTLYQVLPRVVGGQDQEETVGFVAHDQLHAVYVKCIKRQFNTKKGIAVPIENGPLCKIEIQENKLNLAPQELKWIN